MTEEPGLRETFRRGFDLSPEFRKGLGVTLSLAAVAAAGQAAVPFLTAFPYLNTPNPGSR